MASSSESVLSKINTPVFSEGAKILETFYQLYAADEETKDLLKTIRHVTLNVEEVRRRRRQNASHLSPRDLAWIDALISDTADAIAGLATLVEGARVDKEIKESISWWNKGCWVFYYAPKVKEKYQKLTMCHQSLLSIFPFLFNSHSGLASVLEETKEDHHQPCDPTMMKWLGWQDQRQRRKSTVDLRVPTLSQRPISASSSLTDMTIASAVSSNSPALTRSTISEASSPEIRKCYYPATYSQSYSPKSATVSPEIQENHAGGYNKKCFSDSAKSLQSRGSLDLVSDSLGLTYPVFHNKTEDNYDPPSALPEDDIDGGNDDLAPSTKSSNFYDGADGLQVYVPLDGSGVLPDLVHQLQISPSGGQAAKSFQRNAIERSSDGYVDSAETIRRRQAFATLQKFNGADKATGSAQKAIPGPSLPFCCHCSPLDFERPISLYPSSVTGQSPELRTLDDSEDGAEPSLKGKKPRIDRVHSDTYTPRYSVGSRPGLSPSDKVPAASGGGRSLSAGQRGARRGSRSWLAFHSSRSDLSRGDGWGEG